MDATSPLSEPAVDKKSAAADDDVDEDEEDIFGFMDHVQEFEFQVCLK